MVFDAMRKEKETKFSTKEQVNEADKRVKYCNDQKAQVLLSIQKIDKVRIDEVSYDIPVISLR